MQAILLIDFGSTYTKLTGVDLDQMRILGTADDFTTASTDIMIGFEKALQKLQAKTGSISYTKRLACSSAAGGLRMVACGLVPSLTAKAARLAAFGAGAKVIKTYSYQLTKRDVQEIDEINPEILLLVGGTDGGNTEVIEHNAQMLATSQRTFPIVIAGNRASQDACADSLSAGNHPFFITENVMPALNKLNIIPAQAIIRQIFLDRIISGKGLSKEKGLIEGIIMPTPAAALTALTLLCTGTKNETGIGELVAVDLGGATTDIYSIAKGEPLNPGTVLHGLPEPYAKRTVEGDIGMRYSAHGIVEACGLEEMARISGTDEEKAAQWVEKINADKSILPDTDEERMMDFALAALAVRTGLCRHSGTLEMVYTPCGPTYQQTGKDLSQINYILVTGGALIHSERYEDIVGEAVSVQDERMLIPRHAKVILDRQYILSALGLLATYDENIAIKMLKNAFGKD